MRLDEKGLQFEISDDERVYLRDLMRSPGYAVLLKIQSSYVASLQEGATSLSLADPLGNSAQVLNAWTYARVAANVRSALKNGVAFELEVLKLNQAQELHPEELARRRQQQFALEAMGSYR